MALTAVPAVSMGVKKRMIINGEYDFCDNSSKRWSLPGTDDVLVESTATEMKVLDEKSDLSGDLQVRGPNVFKCYFGRPEATAKEFTKVCFLRLKGSSDLTSLTLCLCWFAYNGHERFYYRLKKWKRLKRTSLLLIARQQNAWIRSQLTLLWVAMGLTFYAKLNSFNSC